MERVLLIGHGLIGAKHLAVVEASDRAIICGVVVKDRRKHHSLGSRYSVFTDLSEAIKNCKPTCAIIASPNECHLDHTKTCMLAGLPVLVEKPIAATASEAKQIYDLAQSLKPPVLVGHHRAYNPMLVSLKDLLHSGELGSIQTFVGSAQFHKPPEYYKAAWRVGKKGGPIRINMIHEIGAMRTLISEIERITVVKSSSFRGLPVEDKAAFSIGFQCGAVGTFMLSDCSASPLSWECTTRENPDYPVYEESCYWISGSKGTIGFPSGRLYRADDEPSWHRTMALHKTAFCQEDPFCLQLDHFMDVVVGKVKPLVSAYEGMRNLQLLEGACEA